MATNINPTSKAMAEEIGCLKETTIIEKRAIKIETITIKNVILNSPFSLKELP